MSEPAVVQDDAASWRETLLQRLLITTTPLVVAGIAMAIAATSGRNRLTFLFVLPAIAIQILAIFRRSWPYALRAWLLIAPLVLGATLAYYLTGFKGNASVVAACVVVLTGLLFDRRTMVIVLGLLALVPLAVGIAMVGGLLTTDDLGDLSSAKPLPWVRTTFVGVACWALLGLAITFVVQRIEGELTKTKQALADLRAEAARRQRAEAERRVAEEAALQAQKMELVGRLAAGVAHDFNNVLSVVASWADLGLDETSSRQDRAEAREALAGSVLQGRALTRQLLALARRDARIVTRFNLERPIKSGVQTLSRVMPEGVVLSFEAEAAAPVEVDADEAELQQVLFNLVLNARDALAEGAEIQVRTGVVSVDSPREVVAGTLAPGRYATLEVRDDGSGIDPAVQARIFELFFSTKPIGLGTGLGLATVLRIAQENGGAITFESKVNAGALFALYLPIARA